MMPQIATQTNQGLNAFGTHLRTFRLHRFYVMISAFFSLIRPFYEKTRRTFFPIIKESICEVPEVYGAYDLSLHNYGPEDMQESVHVEIDDDLTALEIQKLTRQISGKIFNEFSIILTVGIYAHNDAYKEIYDDLQKIASEYPEVLEIHGFIVYEKKNSSKIGRASCRERV